MVTILFSQVTHLSMSNNPLIGLDPFVLASAVSTAASAVALKFTNRYRYYSFGLLSAALSDFLHSFLCLKITNYCSDALYMPNIIPILKNINFNCASILNTKLFPSLPEGGW